MLSAVVAGCVSSGGRSNGLRANGMQASCRGNDGMCLNVGEWSVEIGEKVDVEVVSIDRVGGGKVRDEGLGDVVRDERWR